MIDFANVEKCRENNRIEAKKALGGLPHSIWETYSAFANTLGGVILLGVEEYRDKTFHTVDLPDPQSLISEFRRLLVTPGVVSVNILSDDNVYVKNVNGHNIVVIEVPRGTRFDKPVYIGSDPKHGTYRRGGEGDYRCSEEEVAAMQRDASVMTEDMEPVLRLFFDDLDQDAVTKYVDMLNRSRIGEGEDSEALLKKAGALVKGEDGEYHPTAAALLLLGKRDDILYKYPTFSLKLNGTEVYGNLLSFYLFVCEALCGDGINKDDIYSALRETLVNCIVNADYRGEDGVSVETEDNFMTFTNPGTFRVSVDTALRGGVSDPRNVGLIKLFNLISASNSLGRGIPFIFETWRKKGFKRPMITEKFDENKTEFILSFEVEDQTEPSNDKWLYEQQKMAVVELLTKNITAEAEEVAEYLGISFYAAEDILKRILSEDIIVSETKEEKLIYSLKA